jgi:hypothetical protein
MARTSARNVRPSLSDDPRDKLLAAFNCWCGMFKKGISYERAPMYFDACWEWFQALPEEDQETVVTLAVVGSPHKGAAESMAAHLPPAPRCPL